MCQWLDYIDMHLFDKLDQNITCGSRAFSLTANGRMDEQTNIVIVVQP